MLIRIIEENQNLVAICDSDLIGKKFEEGIFQLDVKESFFKEDKVSEEEAVKIMRDFSKEDATFNIVGEKSISIALKTGIISKDGIKKIQGIPFAMVLM